MELLAAIIVTIVVAYILARLVVWIVEIVKR